MKKNIFIFLFFAFPAFVHAQLLPDPFPAPPSNSNFYYQNLGQIKDASGNLRPDIKYYTEGTFPKLYFAEDKVHFTAFKLADTTLPGAQDSSFRIDLKFLCDNIHSKNSIENNSINTNHTSLNCGVLHTYEQGQDHLNYYLPHCPAGIEDVPGYARLVYENAYNNIDVHFYSNAAAMKTYLVIKPGGNPSDINFLFSGQDSIKTLGSGSLAMYLKSWTMQFPQAFAYQLDAANNIIPIASWLPTWNHTGGGVVNIATGPYDPSKTLVITIGGNEQKPTDDDNLVWSFFYGDSKVEYLPRILTAGNNFYHALCQSGGNFPSQLGSNQIPTEWKNGQDLYISQFNTAGVRAWATYCGGTYPERADAMAAGTYTGEKFYNGVWVAGYTGSHDLPFSNGTGVFKQGPNIGSSPQFNDDGILVFFDNSGKLQYGTYFGAGNNADDYITDIGIDEVSNSLFIVGSTTNAAQFDNNCSAQTDGDFPLCQGPPNSFFQGGKQIAEDQEGFIAQFSLSNMELVWSTLFGGPGKDNIKSIKVVDNAIDKGIYIGGITSCTSVSNSFPSPITSHALNTFPLADPGNGAFFQSSTYNEPNTSHNFVSKFDFIQGAYQLSWSTFLGKSAGGIKNIELNSSNKLYVVSDGMTVNAAALPGPLGNNSGRVPVYNNGSAYYENPTEQHQNTLLAKFDNNYSMSWSTYLYGGANPTYADNPYYKNIGLAIDNKDKIFVAPSFIGPFPAPYYNISGVYVQQQNASIPLSDDSRYDGYLLALNANEELTWATFFGGAIATSNTSNNIDSWDMISDISVNNNNELFVTGDTKCPESPYNRCPTAPGAYCDQTYDYNFDCHISKFNTTLLPDITGIKDKKTELTGLAVYPNPSGAIFNVYFFNNSNFTDGTLRIADIYGRVVNKSNLKIKQSVNRIVTDLSNLAPGIYILEIDNGNSKSSTKILKK